MKMEKIVMFLKNFIKKKSDVKQSKNTTVSSQHPEPSRTAGKVKDLVLESSNEKKKEKNKMEFSRNSIDNLFDISYHNNHSKRVRLGKLQAKRERFAEYYANGEMSEDDYRHCMTDLDRLEAEINNAKPKKSNARSGIILCKATKQAFNSGYSFEAQENRLVDYCNDMGISIIGSYKLVGNAKNTKLLFKYILEYIDAQKGTIALVCETISRFLRSKEEYYRVLKLCKTGKLELHFVRDELVFSSNANPNDLLHYGLILGLTDKLAS